jgi:hypothetical protein
MGPYESALYEQAKVRRHKYYGCPTRPILPPIPVLVPIPPKVKRSAPTKAEPLLPADCEALEPPKIMRARPTIQNICHAVCRYYCLDNVAIRAKRRTAKIVFPRHVLFYLARKLTTRPLTEIGRRLGGWDHTTVMHGADKIERLLAKDPSLQMTIADIYRLLGRKWKITETEEINNV